MITTIVSLAFAAVVTFGSNVADIVTDTFEQTSAPLTWEDSPEAMVEQASTATHTWSAYSWVNYVDSDGNVLATVNDPELYHRFNHCEQVSSVFVEQLTGVIYGDQDGNGRLDGDDCNWN